jgi:hypothetical protein
VVRICSEHGSVCESLGWGCGLVVAGAEWIQLSHHLLIRFSRSVKRIGNWRPAFEVLWTQWKQIRVDRSKLSNTPGSI